MGKCERFPDGTLCTFSVGNQYMDIPGSVTEGIPNCDKNRRTERPGRRPDTILWILARVNTVFFQEMFGISSFVLFEDDVQSQTGVPRTQDKNIVWTFRPVNTVDDW